MPSLLIQTGSATIVIAVVVLVLAIGLMAFMFARSGAQRREREARVRDRLLEMEREGQFAAAADRVPVSRRPAEMVSHIAGLFHEYLSMCLLAVYAGQETEASLVDVSGESEVWAPSLSMALPDSVPASLLTKHSQPAVVNLALIGGKEAATSHVAEEPSDEQIALKPEESADADHIEQGQTWVGSGNEPPAGPGIEDVMLVPWHGPFQWNGLIVVSVPAGTPADALDPYRESLARLTDRLAVALELELTDAAIEAFDERASRTTDFSRSLISCLEEVSPLDAIVREVTRLMGSDSAALWRVDEAGAMVRMVAAYGLKSPEFLPLPIGQGLAGGVAQSGETLAIEDAPADPRCIFPREARESGIVAYLGAALAADSDILGVIEVHCGTRRSWTESDRRALESAATVISELVKSTDSRGNRLRVESAYLGLSEALQRLRSPDEVKEAVVEVLGHALGASRVMVVEFNDLGQTDPIRQEYRQPSAKSALGATFEETLVAKVASSAGTQAIAIAGSQELSLMGAEMAAELDVVSELAVPIRVDGKTSAIVYVHQCDRVREWEHEEVEFAERVVRQLSLSLSNLGSRELALTEAQLARDEARRASEGGSRAEAMLTGLPEMVIGLDREGNLSFFNAAAADRRGLTPDDLGRPAESLTNAENPIWRQIATCESVTRFDAQMNLRSGAHDAMTPVSISAAPLRNEKGEISGRLIVASDLSHTKSGDASERIQQLEQKLQSLERVLAHSRDVEEQARAMLGEASALEAKARSEADDSRRAEAETRQQLERVQEEHKQVQGSAQQLLEINKLKSEFIVNAGHEIEASLQSVLGLAELLERGSYGNLTAEQREAVHGIYGWARRIKSDVDWLIEYGSTRTRRLESSGG
ncbi:MAG: GAF domain-containing protein [Acidobacteriota bacterium]